MAEVGLKMDWEKAEEAVKRYRELVKNLLKILREAPVVNQKIFPVGDIEIRLHPKLLDGLEKLTDDFFENALRALRQAKNQRREQHQ